MDHLCGVDFAGNNGVPSIANEHEGHRADVQVEAVADDLHLDFEGYADNGAAEQGHDVGQAGRSAMRGKRVKGVPRLAHFPNRLIISSYATASLEVCTSNNGNLADRVIYP